VISLLARLFIRDREKVSDPDVRQAYGVLCGAVGICLNLILFGVKYFAGVISGSIAVTADAFNNLSDAGSSVVTLLGFRLARIRPDLDHPYGHGRLEYVSGLVVSAIIIVMAFELGKSSVEKILAPQSVAFGPLPAMILLASVAVKLYMFLYNRSVGKRIGSAAMRATAAVLAGMLIARFTGASVDGWLGVLVALFILYSGAMSAWDTLSPLLGQAPEPEFVRGVEETVLAHPEIRNVHDLMVHDYGPGRRMITLHAEVGGDCDLFEIHDTIDNIEYELQRHFGCIATIHMDPIEADNASVSRLRGEIAGLVKTLDPGVTIHDFRVVPGKTHTNLIFDAVLPVGWPGRDEEAAAAIRALVAGRFPDHHVIIHIDHALV